MAVEQLDIHKQTNKQTNKKHQTQNLHPSQKSLKMDHKPKCKMKNYKLLEAASEKF